MDDATARDLPASAHLQPAAEVLVQLESSVAGLSSDEAAARLASHGRNRLPEPPRAGVVRRFVRHFHNVLIYVLLAAAAITFLLDHLTDTAVILAVVVINAIIGFIQEGKAEKAMDAIRQMLAPGASVLRDGARRGVLGEEVVPGDIVLLEPGDRVPADLRLVQVHGLEIQEAILTGESLAVEKQAAAVSGDTALGDRLCMAYSGTLVTSGQGRGVVVATGAATEIGRISGLLADVRTLTTPLLAQMAVFSNWLTLFILTVSGALLAFGYFSSYLEFGDMFMVVVGLAVAAIPEGLPAVLTITLAIGVQAMAKRNAIVRRLPAIETLGSVSVICTDKTGTLTRNEMMVAAVAAGGELFTLDGNGYEPEGMICGDDGRVTAEQRPVLAEIGRAAALCNDAALQQREGVWSVAGDPMEGALLAFAGKVGVDHGEQHNQWTRTDAIPFDPDHRFMATLNHDHDRHGVIYLKGAPEKIIAMCRDQRSTDGGCEVLDKDWWHRQAEAIAEQGQRVLALAALPVEPTHTVLEHADIAGTPTLLGLVGLIDPPRSEAIAAVAECRGAGIRVKMITGDHAVTARAIGRQIGLENCQVVLSGADLDAMDDAALAAAVGDTDIFARTSPEHKLRLVMALQAQGLTVAMTGDGVNDAPALKRADVGVAMGQKGSEAAKEAAEMVLADDNFASIVAAVREGRTVYDNIKKVITWTLPTNAGEAATIMIALVFGMTLPITPIQILWINLITAVTLGLALAFEPTEPRTMGQPPRPRTAPLLSGELLWYILMMSVLFLCGVYGIFRHAIDVGHSVELARTMAVNTLVVMEIAALFFTRNIHSTSLTWKAVRGTPVVWATVVAVTAAQFAITYVPVMQQVFATEAVPLADGVLIVAVGAALLAIVETEKQVRLRWRARHHTSRGR